jgi:hypothetical protein
MTNRKKTIACAILFFVLFVPALSTAQVAWVKDFDSALKKAVKENKFIVLDMSASW